MSIRIKQYLPAAIALLFSCLSFFAEAENKLDSGADFIKSEIIYQDCWSAELIRSKAKCGLLSVPANYDKKHQPIRWVSFAILPALGGTKSKLNQPVLFLIGGPAPSGTLEGTPAFLKGQPGEFLRLNRDLIIVDYRGVGMSKPFLGCELPDGPNDIKPCAESYRVAGLDESEVRSAVFAKDADRLIETLGYESVVVYGASYGVRLALTMMRDVPQRISHVVLDGIFPPKVNGLSEGAWPVLAGLRKIVTRCQKNQECQSAFGDLNSKVETLAAQWSTQENADELLIGLSRFAYHPAAPLLIETLVSLSPVESAKLMERLASVRYNNNLEYRADKNTRPKPEAPSKYSVSIPMSLAVMCSEEAAFMEQQPFDQGRHDFSQDLNKLLYGVSVGSPIPPAMVVEICKRIPVSAAPSIETEPVKSEIKTLLLSGGMDMQTSFEWGELVTKSLPNSQHYIFPYSDHVVFFTNACSRSITQQFIAFPDRKIDSSCFEKEKRDFIFKAENIENQFLAPE